jgi:hypothetical protein
MTVKFRDAKRPYVTLAIFPGGCHPERMTSAGAPGAISELLQLRHQAVTMIALDLDYGPLYGAAGATEFLQARRQIRELGCAQWQAGYHRDGLAAAARDLAPDAHPPGGRGRGFHGCDIDDRCWP